MIAGAYAPAGPGAGAGPGGSSSPWLGATFGSISAIASIDAGSRCRWRCAGRSPGWPRRRAGPPDRWSVPGRSRRSRRMRRSRSGSHELWRSMNDAAAASAASSRFGGMSVAHMLRETSIARMTVVWPAGTADDRRRAGPSRSTRLADREERTGRTAGGAGCATSAARRRGSATGSSSATAGRRRRSIQIRTPMRTGKQRAARTRPDHGDRKVGRSRHPPEPASGTRCRRARASAARRRRTAR